MFSGLPAWELIPDIGLYMDQVLTLMERVFDGVLPRGEITRSMINNYVKSGLIPRPTGKKYDRDHLAMLIMICILKQALSMEDIAQLLALAMMDEGGVQQGYTRFLAEAAALEENISRGQIELRAQEPQQQALRAGVSAAVCTMRARRLLCALRAEGGK